MIVKPIRLNILRYLIKLTKDLTIKSFLFNEEVIDFKNVDIYNIDEYIKGDINISRKYIHLFMDKFNTKDISNNILRDAPSLICRTSIENKIIAIDISNHSTIQFIKRFLYLYYSDINFELGYEISQKLELYSQTFLNIFLEDSWDNINQHEDIHNIFKDILSKSKVMKLNNLGRKRDKYEIESRDTRYNTSVRYFSHPFMFIIEDNVLLTVELYSSCYDFRKANHITKDNRKFRTWLHQKGVIND